MPKLQFLQAYGGQTVDEILRLESTHRVDSLVLALEQALDQKRAREGDSSLAEAERVVLAIEALEREVNNGGFHQFFLNSSREFAGQIAGGLDAIGCPECARIARKALATLGTSDQVDAASIEQALEHGGDDLIETFEPVDQAYFSAGENIEAALFEFIRRNKERIRVP